MQICQNTRPLGNKVSIRSKTKSMQERAAALSILETNVGGGENGEVCDTQGRRLLDIFSVAVDCMDDNFLERYASW